MIIFWKCPQCDGTNHTQIETMPLIIKERYGEDSNTEGITDYCQVCDKEVELELILKVKLEGITR